MRYKIIFVAAFCVAVHFCRIVKIIIIKTPQMEKKEACLCRFTSYETAKWKISLARQSGYRNPLRVLGMIFCLQKIQIRTKFSVIDYVQLVVIRIPSEHLSVNYLGYEKNQRFLRFSLRVGTKLGNLVFTIRLQHF